MVKVGKKGGKKIKALLLLPAGKKIADLYEKRLFIIL